MKPWIYHWPSRKREMQRVLAAKTWQADKPPLHANQGTGKATPAEPRWTAADESRALVEIERAAKE